MNRRHFLQMLTAIGATLMTGHASAFGDDDLFTIGIIRYDTPSWNPRPTALRRLLMEVEMTTSVLVSETPLEVDVGGADIFATPLLILAGDRAFDPWTPEARGALRTFLNAGGMLIIDSSEGRIGEFYTSIQRELAEVLPGTGLAPVSDEHVNYKSFYLVNGATGRIVIQDHMEGIEHDGRMAVVFTHNDLMGAWARDNFGNNAYECSPGGERQRTMAYRLGVNLVMYALCLDYKEDQVHIPFILGRRQWRVE